MTTTSKLAAHAAAYAIAAPLSACWAIVDDGAVLYVVNCDEEDGAPVSSRHFTRLPGADIRRQHERAEFATARRIMAAAY